TIRAGYGMYGDRAMMLAGTQVYFSAPFGNLVSVAGANLTDPWAGPSTPAGNPMLRLAALQGVGVYDHNIPFSPNGNYVNTNMQNFKPVYMNQWNLSVQRQIGQDWLVTANYVGNNTIHMITGENINPATYFYNGTNTCILPNGVTINGANGQCSTVANQQTRRVLSLQNPAQGQFYAGIGTIDDGGTASYEGLNF